VFAAQNQLTVNVSVTVAPVGIMTALLRCSTVAGVPVVAAFYSSCTAAPLATPAEPA